MSTGQRIYSLSSGSGQMSGRAACQTKKQTNKETSKLKSANVNSSIFKIKRTCDAAKTM